VIIIDLLIISKSYEIRRGIRMTSRISPVRQGNLPGHPGHIRAPRRAAGRHRRQCRRQVLPPGHGTSHAAAAAAAAGGSDAGTHETERRAEMSKNDMS